MLKRFLLIFTAMILIIPAMVSASTIDISTTNQGDGTWNKTQYMGGSYWNFSAAGDSLGTLYYYYGGADRYFEKTYMQFNLNGFSGNIADIESITFNFNLLDIEGSGTLGTIWHAADSGSATGSASDLLAGGQSVTTITGASVVGWNSIDVTTYLLNDFSQGYNYSAFSTTYSSAWDISFSIASSESGMAPFLRITTSGSGPETGNPVPEPSTMVLMITGLLGLTGLRRKF